MTKKTVVLSLVVVIVVVIIGVIINRDKGEGPPRLLPVYFVEREPVRAEHGAVATSQPLASEAALEVLKNGGNAFDAVVTAAAVMSVVEPYMTGIGGDHFAIFWSAAEERVLGINGSGAAGALATREELLSRGYEQMPWLGAESINVPGALAAWNDMLNRYGTISLAQALAPAIKFAEEGFIVSELTAKEWALFTTELYQHESTRQTFLVDGVRPPRAGERFFNPDLAATYKLIARDGIDAFYNGELTQRIVEHVQSLNGLLTVEDFQRHRSEWVEPISVPFQNYRLWELPPNGQGVAALEIVRILETFDLEAMSHNSTEYLHHMIEATKLASGDLRYFVGEPQFMQISPQEMLTDEFVASRRAQINPKRARYAPPPDPTLSTRDTTYFAVADKDGNMISMINSLAGPFGTGIVVPGTGFALQNRAVAFTLEADRANTIGPGRRPFHTLSPGFLTRTLDNGAADPYLTFGMIGGYQQPQGQLQILFNLLLFDMDIQSAIDAGRFRHLEGPYVYLENTIPWKVVAELEKMGHVQGESDRPGFNGFDYGTAQAILKTQDGYVAGSDPRREGGVFAY